MSAVLPVTAEHYAWLEQAAVRNHQSRDGAFLNNQELEALFHMVLEDMGPVTNVWHPNSNAPGADLFAYFDDHGQHDISIKAGKWMPQKEVVAWISSKNANASDHHEAIHDLSAGKHQTSVLVLAHNCAKGTTKDRISYKLCWFDSPRIDALLRSPELTWCDKERKNPIATLGDFKVEVRCGKDYEAKIYAPIEHGTILHQFEIHKVDGLWQSSNPWCPRTDFRPINDIRNYVRDPKSIVTPKNL
jgi:hypothetical protein